MFLIGIQSKLFENSLKITRWNFFSQYGVAGTVLIEENSRVYEYLYKTPSNFSTYQFVFLDASPPVGMNEFFHLMYSGMPLPFNVFGYWYDFQMTLIESLLQNSSNYNHTIILTHYPKVFPKFTSNDGLGVLSSYPKQ